MKKVRLVPFSLHLKIGREDVEEEGLIAISLQRETGAYRPKQ